MGGLGSGRKPDPIKLLTGAGNSNPTIAIVGEQPLNLPNYSGIKKFIDTHDVIDIPEVDLTPYAKLDGTNQPFFGDVEIYKSTPKITLTDDTEDAYTYIERSPTNDKTSFVSQLRPYFAAKALNSNGGSRARRSAVSIGTVYTVEAWIKTTQSSTYMVVSGSGIQNAIFYMPFSGQLRSYIGTSTFRYWSMSPAINDGNWHHFVLARNGQAITLYIDGVSKGGGTLVGSQNSSVSYNTIGGYGSNTGQNFNGTLDEVVIWNKTLNSTEVTARYNSGIGQVVTDYTNVVAEYRFDNNYNDSSPNNYTLTPDGSGDSFVVGKVAGAEEAFYDVEFLSAYESTTDASAGYLTFGWRDGLGTAATQNIYTGRTHTFNIFGTEYLTIDSDGNIHMPNDNQTLILGAGDDYSISFTGTGALHSITSGYFNFDQSVKINGTGAPSQQLEVVGTILANGGDLATTNDLYTDDWRNTTAGVLVARSTNASGDVVFSNIVDAASYKVGGTAGASGTFTSADGKTISVTNGIITSIV